MTVTIIVVLELILCAGWISQSNAQLSASLLPQEHQSVCHGQYIYYDCIGNGIDMVFYSPPIVNASSPVGQLVIDSVGTCNVMEDTAATIRFVDPSGSSFNRLTFTLFISDKHLEGLYRVFCRVSTADGAIAQNSSDFSVIGAPNREAVNDIEFDAMILSYSDDVAQAAVNISWDSPVNAQEFSLTISNMTGYMNTISSLENRVTVWLPYGTYSANLCVKNRCKKVCQDNSTELLVERQSDGRQNQQDMDSGLLASAVVAGVLGVLLILAVIYSVVITIILWCKAKN